MAYNFVMKAISFVPNVTNNFSEECHRHEEILYLNVISCKGNNDVVSIVYNLHSQENKPCDSYLRFFWISR